MIAIPDSGDSAGTPFVEKPALRPAKQRVLRAVYLHTVLAHMEAQLRADNPPGSVVMSVDRRELESGHPVAPKIDWSAGPSRHSTGEVALLTGEIVYHLRTALDYLAYNLAWLDSGIPREETLFPIVHKVSKWQATCQRRLPGVTDHHKAAIKEYQPFASCTWTSTLQALSNADKHRFLVDVAREYSGMIRADISETTPDPSDESRVMLPITAYAVRHCFVDDDADVVATLTVLLRQVALILDRFQSDFGERDVLELED